MKQMRKALKKHKLHLFMVLALFLLVSVWSHIALMNYNKYYKDKDTSTPFTLTLTSPMTTPPAAPAPAPPQGLNSEIQESPYHDWDLLAAEFKEMMGSFKIFSYPDMSNTRNKFSNIFLPHTQPSLRNWKLGNYMSEHFFKSSLFNSPLLTQTPSEAHLFYLPFSINDMRNDPRLHSEASIAEFVAAYVNGVSRRFGFWNLSGGADHFYVHCHSVGREAMSRHPGLLNNAIQVTCSSSYFQRLYVAHKDVSLPQIWPRPRPRVSELNPPHARHRLVFYAGRTQNSHIRQELVQMWGNDTELDIFDGSPSFSYEDGFRSSKYCLHVKGYEVNTARITDAIHYGCIPVIISNYYDLPFANILNWNAFSVIINQADIVLLKTLLLGIPQEKYMNMYRNLCRVRKHFEWHLPPRGYDSFYLTAYELWLRRSIQRFSI